MGAKLRLLRETAGLTVRQLAKDFHRAHSTVVEVELGRRLAAVELIVQYEKRFDLPPGTLGAERESARMERLQDPQDGTVAEHLGEDVCPYKGLLAFQRADATRFFGRETQVKQVLRRLRETRFVAVVGPSGSGKSSFVRAGLLAGLDAMQPSADFGARIALLTPGAHPVDELAAATGSACGVVASPTDLRADPRYLRRLARLDGGGPLVIAVDQLEELFTVCQDEAERRCFIDALVTAWRDPLSPVVVVLALRADFYGRVMSYQELSDAVLAHQTMIGPMGDEELRRAIELPAGACGLDLQPGLAQTIVEDLAGEPGALPLLSHALLETWNHRTRRLLTLRGYREAGGVRDGISRTADRTLRALPESDQVIARAVFLSLTNVDDETIATRRRVDRAELVSSQRSVAALDRVLGVLADARLVTLGEHTVEVAHEALIRHWATLRGWIETDRNILLQQRRMTSAAREWDALQREPAALYRGIRLAAVGDWSADRLDELGTLDREFLSESRAAERREAEASARRRRRMRQLACGLLALSLAVAALAGWALQQRSDARAQAAQATSSALASSALAVIDSRPDVALLLALAAERERPTLEARSSMIASLETVRDPGLVGILHGHTDVVNTAAFSPDGKMLASGSTDETIRLWNVQTHRQLGRPLTGHTERVTTVVFSPDGRTLVSGGWDGAIRIWDVRSHKQLVRALTHPGASIDHLAMSPDGRKLATVAFGDRRITIWDLHSRREIGVLQAAASSLATSVAFGPGGQILATGEYHGTIRLWNVRTLRQIGRPLVGHTDGVYDVAFSPDGTTLASGSADNTIRLWDVAAHRERGAPLVGDTGTVESVAFSPDGRTLASGSWDKTVRLWNLHSGRQLGPPLAGHTARVESVAFDRAGRTLVSASDDDTLRVWDVRAEERLGAPLIMARTVASVAFSRDGSTLASGGADGTVRLWDAATHRPRGKPLRGPTARVDSLTFNPDGDTLAAGSADGSIRLWDPRTGQMRGAPLVGHSGGVEGLAFDRAGRMLASGGTSGAIQFWNVATHGQLGGPLPRFPISSFTNVVFSADGRTLASADHAQIVLWDVRSRTLLGELRATNNKFVESIALSGNGGRLASADIFKTVRLWDTRTHRQLGQPLTVPGIVSLALTRDGRTLVGGTGDGTIRLWDVATHKQLGIPLTGQPGEVGLVGIVALSPDGRTIASVDSDKTLRLWQGIFWDDAAQLRKHVCDLVGSSLSSSEWAQYSGGIGYRKTCP